MSSIYMVVLGLGFGLVTQVLMVGVQNAVPYRRLGTATSAATFFRSIDGSFGVALSGAIFNSAVFAELPRYLPAAVWHTVEGHAISSNPSQIAKLPAPIRHGYVEAFSHWLETVFLIGVPLALAAFLLTWLLKEVPLREHAFLDDEDAVSAETVQSGL